MKTFTSFFLLFALYTPAFCFMSHLTTTYGDFSFAPVMSHIISIFLMLMPLYVLYFIDNNQQK
jgi:hypothetical protein